MRHPLIRVVSSGTPVNNSITILSLIFILKLEREIFASIFTLISLRYVHALLYYVNTRKCTDCLTTQKDRSPSQGSARLAPSEGSLPALHYMTFSQCAHVTFPGYCRWTASKLSTVSSQEETKPTRSGPSPVTSLNLNYFLCPNRSHTGH